MNLNRVILAGHLTRDPEAKFLPSGLSVTSFGIAISRKWSKDGEPKEEVCFVDVSCFGKTADNVGKYFVKGSPILVEGYLKLDQWEDKEGQKKSKLKVIADSFHFVGAKSGDLGKAGSTKKPTKGSNVSDVNDEEIPF